MSFPHTIMSPTPAGLTQSFDPVTQEESWQLLAVTLILLLSISWICYDGRTEVCWPTFQMTNTHISSPQFSSHAVKGRVLYMAPRCKCCGSESDSDSPTLWFIISEMRRALYNVCSTVQCTLSASASNCQGQVYFMPPYHAIFTHLHMPSEWSSSKQKKSVKRL